jgi:hypothetical protein
MAWINGLKSFLDVAEPHRSSKGFMCCPSAFVEITRNCPEEALYTSTLLKGVSWISILFGQGMVNLKF